jgi:hypothetical protein
MVPVEPALLRLATVPVFEVPVPVVTVAPKIRSSKDTRRWNGFKSKQQRTQQLVLAVSRAFPPFRRYLYIFSSLP